MACVNKFTNDAMCNMLRHNNRTIAQSANPDIDPQRSSLNYSFPLGHKGLTDYQYYKFLLATKYIYGRGSKREKNTVTGCSWVVSLPKELSGDPDKEKAFFSGVFNFVCERYGKENIINATVHYDEAGQPHIHIIFCPVTKIDHDVIRHKTMRTKQAIRLPSGRYEYAYRFKLDANGQKIKLPNYAKASDRYNEKIDANSVLNKIELRNFHPELQKYLSEHWIEGSVMTGKTNGINFNVKDLKDFTAKTGLHLNDIREMQGEKTLLESYVDQASKIHELEKSLEHSLEHEHSGSWEDRTRNGWGTTHLIEEEKIW